MSAIHHSHQWSSAFYQLPRAKSGRYTPTMKNHPNLPMQEAPLGPAWICPNCNCQNPPTHDTAIQCSHCSWTPNKSSVRTHEKAESAITLDQKRIFQLWLFCLIPVRLLLAWLAKVLPGGHCGFQSLAIMGFIHSSLAGFALCATIHDAPPKFVVPMAVTELFSPIAFLALL